MFPELQVKGPFSSTYACSPCTLAFCVQPEHSRKWHRSRDLSCSPKVKGHSASSAPDQQALWGRVLYSLSSSLPPPLSPSFLSFPPSLWKYSHPDFKSQSPSWETPVIVPQQWHRCPVSGTTALGPNYLKGCHSSSFKNKNARKRMEIVIPLFLLIETGRFAVLLPSTRRSLLISFFLFPLPFLSLLRLFPFSEIPQLLRPQIPVYSSFSLQVSSPQDVNK